LWSAPDHLAFRLRRNYQGPPLTAVLVLGPSAGDVGLAGGGRIGATVPDLVGDERVLEANGRLPAVEAMAEITSFF
jgi:hypothetical protein